MFRLRCLCGCAHMHPHCIVDVQLDHGLRTAMAETSDDLPLAASSRSNPGAMLKLVDGCC